MAWPWGVLVISLLLDKLEFGGESPRTSRAWCSAFRYCPDPLGIVTAEQLDKLEFVFTVLLPSLLQDFSCNGLCFL